MIASVAVPPTASIRTPPTRFVGDEHHPLAVAAVGQRAGHGPDHEVGGRVDRPDDPHRQSRAREGEHEQRQGGQADGVAAGRDRLADEEGRKVAVPAEGLVAGGPADVGF